MYVRRVLKNGHNARCAIKSQTNAKFILPKDPAEDASQATLRLWEKIFDEVMKQKADYIKNMKMAYSIILGQCMDQMISKLESREDYSVISSTGNALILLKNIRDIAFKFQSQKKGIHAIIDAEKQLLMTLQNTMSVQDYYHKFKNQIDVIKHCGSTLVQPKQAKACLPSTIASDATEQEDQVKKAAQDAKQLYAAMLFILNSDKAWFGKYIDNLENAYLQGTNNYPLTLVDAFHRLEYWRQDPCNIVKMVNSISDGVAFANIGKPGK